MFSLRAPTRLYEVIRNLPHLFPRVSEPRRNSRSEKVVLVGTTEIMYTDLLTKVKNAQKAKKDALKVPYSNLDFAVAEILAKNSYLDTVAKKGRMPKRIIEIKLKYANGKGAINGINILSKPSRRLYAGYSEFRKIKQGYGLAIVSTSKGLMTTLAAKKAKIGGQLLFEIW